MSLGGRGKFEGWTFILEKKLMDRCFENVERVNKSYREYRRNIPLGIHNYDNIFLYRKIYLRTHNYFIQINISVSHKGKTV